MPSTPAPLLTICLPTMNRPGLLELGLINLIRETELFGDAVEILVTDNGSTAPNSKGGPMSDGSVPPTRTVEEIVRQVSPLIRYVRVPGAPVVFARSFLFGPTNHARGEYVWVIGDDDLVIHGAVGRILDFLRSNPDLDYVYLNHGWIPVERRNWQIQNGEACMPVSYREYHSKDRTSRRLDRMEDLIPLAACNPYASFSTIFCYVARRRLYLDHGDVLQLTDDWDEAYVNFSAIFPHTHLTMAVFGGQPVGYVGEPCFAQGSSTAVDGKWLYHSMSLGHLQLFEWLRDHAAFDRGALAHLTESLAYMAGRMMARIQASPGDHNGIDNIRTKVLPKLVQFPAFLEGFEIEAREVALLDYEAKLLAAEWKKWLATSAMSAPRIAIWDSNRRGAKMLQVDPGVEAALAVVVSRSEWQVWPHQILLQQPKVLEAVPHDVLILAVPRSRVLEFLPQAAVHIKPGTPVITLEGEYRAEGSECVRIAV